MGEGRGGVGWGGRGACLACLTTSIQLRTWSCDLRFLSYLPAGPQPNSPPPTPSLIFPPRPRLQAPEANNSNSTSSNGAISREPNPTQTRDVPPPRELGKRIAMRSFSLVSARLRKGSEIMVVVKIFLPNSAGYLTLSVSSSLALSKLKLMVFQRVRKKYGANKKKRGSAGAPVRSPRWIQRLMKKSSSDYKLKWHLESDIKGLSAEQLSCVVSNEDVIVDTLTAVRTANDAADVIALVTREIGNDAEAEVVKTYNSESTAADQAPSDVENKSGGKKDLAPNATWTRPIELELLEVSKMDGGTDEGR